MKPSIRFRLRLLVMTVLLLTMTTGVAAAQSGGGGGEFVSIIESLIQFLQTVVDVLTG